MRSPGPRTLSRSPATGSTSWGRPRDRPAGSPSASSPATFDGTSDTSFSGDGRQIPDRPDRRAQPACRRPRRAARRTVAHRGSTDVDPSGGERYDVLLVGLLADGSPDPRPAGGMLHLPGRRRHGERRGDGDRARPGRPARGGGQLRDQRAFVAVRGADGSPAAGGRRVRVLTDSRAAGVAFRPDGTIAALLQRASSACPARLHGHRHRRASFGTTAGELVLPLTPPATAGGLIAQGGRLVRRGELRRPGVPRARHARGRHGRLAPLRDARRAPGDDVTHHDRQRPRRHRRLGAGARRRRLDHDRDVLLAGLGRGGVHRLRPTALASRADALVVHDRGAAGMSPRRSRPATNSPRSAASWAASATGCPSSCSTAATSR